MVYLPTFAKCRYTIRGTSGMVTQNIKHLQILQQTHLQMEVDSTRVIFRAQKPSLCHGFWGPKACSEIPKLSWVTTWQGFRKMFAKETRWKKPYKTLDTGTGTSKNQVKFVGFDLIENFKLMCLASVDGFFWGGGSVGLSFSLARTSQFENDKMQWIKTCAFRMCSIKHLVSDDLSFHVWVNPEMHLPATLTCTRNPKMYFSHRLASWSNDSRCNTIPMSRGMQYTSSIKGFHSPTHKVHEKWTAGAFGFGAMFRWTMRIFHQQLTIWYPSTVGTSCFSVFFFWLDSQNLPSKLQTH